MYNGDFSFGGQTSPWHFPIHNPFATRLDGANWGAQSIPGQRQSQEHV